jgi:Ribbon-helix-helix protein, copG family.
MVKQSDRKQVAVRLELRKKAKLEAEAADEGVSRSEYVRNIIENRHEIDDLEQKLNIREARIDELEYQLSKRSQIEAKIDNLPDQVRDKQTYSERRQKLLDNATLTQRLRWKFTGVPVAQQSEAES